MKHHYYPLSNKFTLISLIALIIAIWTTLFDAIPSEIGGSALGFACIVLLIIFVIASMVSAIPEDL
ncbi:MAG: hypothetical protein ACMXYC_01140 [Candidatus Woesearchaeota archaeon]